ncbi:MAG: hypothetical protein ACOCSE_03750 [Chitinivibrionales bacterium]
MDSEMERYIRGLEDEDLIQGYSNKDEYTEEAVRIMESEIGNRGLSVEEGRDEEHKEDVVDYKLEPLGFFTPADTTVAVQMLEESEVVFSVVRPENGTSDIQILVADYEKEKAHKKLEEGFYKKGEYYYIHQESLEDVVKQLDLREIEVMIRKAGDIELDIQENEFNTIRGYALKIIENINEIEERLGGPVFFYDDIEEITENPVGYTITKENLGVVFEILKIAALYFHEGESLPNELREVAEPLVEIIS